MTDRSSTEAPQAIHDFLRCSESSITIYLSGTIRKGAHDTRPDYLFWSDDEEKYISENIADCAPRMLNPAKTPIQRGDFRANFGCDLYLISISDVMMVDARHEKGVGVGAEMMYAHLFEIPVITICPPNSNYRRSFLPNVYGEDLHNWTHPFIDGLSDHIADNVQHAVAIINSLGCDGLRESRREPLPAAIQYFRQKYGIKD